MCLSVLHGETEGAFGVVGGFEESHRWGLGCGGYLVGGV
jgi:hypothetical protein